MHSKHPEQDASINLQFCQISCPVCHLTALSCWIAWIPWMDLEFHRLVFIWQRASLLRPVLSLIWWQTVVWDTEKRQVLLVKTSFSWRGAFFKLVEHTAHTIPSCAYNRWVDIHTGGYSSFVFRCIWDVRRPVILHATLRTRIADSAVCHVGQPPVPLWWDSCWVPIPTIFWIIFYPPVPAMLARRLLIILVS